MSFLKKSGRPVPPFDKVIPAPKPEPVATTPDVADPKRKRTPTKFGGLLGKQAEVATKTLLGH